MHSHSKKNFLISGTGIILLLVVSFLFLPPSSKGSLKDEVHDSILLEARGNRLVQVDTDSPIILKGGVSDYFRYKLKHYGSEKHDIEHELMLVNSMLSHGANVMGLYMSDFNKIKENIHELDMYVDFAFRNNMYIYFMPVARDFSESYYPVAWYAEYAPTDENDLTQLIEFLAERYKTKDNVIYGFGAEPDMPLSLFSKWYNKQVKLASIVRKQNPRAMLIITGVGQYDMSGFKDKPFPFKNIIYQVGGYISDNDEYYFRIAKNPAALEQRYSQVTDHNGLGDTYPILVGEFGGNVMKDFSSEIDLMAIRNILETIKDIDISYTAYRIGAAFEGDPLSLFDRSGNLTPRGAAFIEGFRE